MGKLEELVALLEQCREISLGCLVEYCEDSYVRTEAIGHALANGEIGYSMVPYDGDDTPELRKSADELNVLYYLNLIEDGDYSDKVKAFKELIREPYIIPIKVLEKINSEDLLTWLRKREQIPQEDNFPPELEIAVKCSRSLYRDGVPADASRTGENSRIKNWLDANYNFNSTDQRRRIVIMVNPVPTKRIYPPTPK